MTKALGAPLSSCAERPEYNELLQEVLSELGDEKRVQKSRDFPELMYQNAEWIALGSRSITWGMSKRVGDWPQVTGNGYENHLEYVPYLGGSTTCP